MSQHVSPPTEVKVGSHFSSRWLYPVLVVVMGILLSAIYYGFRVGHQALTEHSPWVDAAMEIKLEATTAHLWFEEIVSGDKSVAFSEIKEHTEEAIWFATAMLEGGSNSEGVFLPVSDKTLRKQIEEVRSQLVLFQEITQQRWDNILTSGIGSDIDQEYDRVFNNLIINADQVETAILHHISYDLKRFSFTRNILFISCLILSCLLVVVFFLVERRRAADFFKIQEAKHQAEAKELWLRVTMRSMGDALITTDTTAKVTYLNPVASSLTGWAIEEALGEDINKVFNIVNEKTRERAINPVNEVLKKKFIVGLANHTALISKSGKEYPIADSGAPIIDQEGNCIGAVLVFHDVSERVAAENKLRAARNEWERSFNAIHDLITIQDKEMRITKSNTATCSFFKMKEGDIVGRYCYEIFRGESEPCPGCPILEAQQDLLHHESIIEHKRLRKTFQVSCAPVFDENYDLEYFVHSAKDITERVLLEEDLSQARKMEAIGTLAGGIAHDFNNILASIMGYTELALAEKEVGRTISDYLAEVLKAGKRATGLVRQILTFSRKGADEQTAPLDPHFIVKESMKFIRASLPTSIQLQTDIDPSSGTIIADPTKIQQVLVNLCTNAAHALRDETGLLQVKLSKCQLTADEVEGKEGVSPGPFVKLSVSDTGSGIDQATLDRIFEPYFTTKKQGKGTGLGLSMVHGIVQDYHGMIEVESELGKGTTFHIYFPAIEEIAAVSEEGYQEAIPGGNERILVVDDEEVIVGLQKASLQRLGYTVTGMTNSIEALEKFQASPESFDLVITDQTMPEMFGMELAKKILGIRPNIPIIMNTGYSSMASAEQAREVGIKEFVMKPIDRRTLAAIVRKVLDDA